ncbi:hypothetical protein LAZ67_5001653 [Cordylochernes scorpioides]|uniref:Reverse transcriptase domain-containing protein n=1 Tax=Cordylochernes scorpioides TaxID=51811 RepID=A0ABY6KGX5_9ARAC|nr:hypothetical protein LAZ67_5001653 [Cordylochernes scorpioides]
MDETWVHHNTPETKQQSKQSVVILNTEDYINRMKTHLNNTEFFIKIEPQEASKSITAFKKSIHQLLKTQIIDQSLKKQILENPGTHPYIYGLPKIHKKNTPLRPIVAYNQSPAYFLSKHLANRLSEITKNLPYIVKNPEEILQKMKNFKLKADHRIVSYDVKDLYTSLPHDLIMDSLQTILIKHKEAYPDHLAILKLTKICLKSTTVKFTGEYYNQIKGTPMGSPLSTILAEIVLSTIDSWITEAKPNEILIWSRYVNDIFCIITENSENHILETLNSFNSSIQFTIEKENKRRLPFLEILFTRNRTGFTTKVYRKPTSPTQYLHFASNSPISQKIIVVRTLTKRAFTHCSSKIEYNKELNFIENQLLKSGYPLPFIKRNRYKPGTPRNNSNHYISTCYLPYTESTITIARKLKSFGIKTIFRSSPSIASILRNPITKSTDQKQKKDLVYQIPCLNCNSAYIGETSRDLSIRIKEHQRNISKLNPNSLIVDHRLPQRLPGRPTLLQCSSTEGNMSSSDVGGNLRRQAASVDLRDGQGALRTSKGHPVDVSSVVYVGLGMEGVRHLLDLPHSGVVRIHLPAGLGYNKIAKSLWARIQCWLTSRPSSHWS